MRLSLKRSALAIVVAAVAGNAVAANQTWVGPGSNWTGSTNWSGADWVSGNNAIFGNTGARTVTVNTAVSASGLEFSSLSSSPNYVISGSPQITLEGAGSMAAHASATILAPMGFASGGNSNWVIDSTQTLTIGNFGTLGGNTRSVNLSGGGTLLVKGTAYAFSGLNINVGKAILDAGSLASVVNVNSGTELAGTGTVYAMLGSNTGGTVAPGISSVGTINASMMMVGYNTKYALDLTKTSSDLISMGDILHYGSLWNLDLNLNFVPTVLGSDSFYQWTIAQASNVDKNLGHGFSTSYDSAYAINLPGGSEYLAQYFSLAVVPWGVTGEKLVLTYNAVPEATTMVLGGLAVMPLVLHRRRSRRQA